MNHPVQEVKPQSYSHKFNTVTTKLRAPIHTHIYIYVHSIHSSNLSYPPRGRMNYLVAHTHMHMTSFFQFLSIRWFWFTLACRRHLAQSATQWDSIQKHEVEKPTSILHYRFYLSYTVCVCVHMGML